MTNSIRDDLNRGGDKVARAERRFEHTMVEHLAEATPVCIAYRMPTSPPWLTESFLHALRIAGRSAKTWSPEHPLQAHLLQSRLAKDTGAAFPAELALKANEALREQFAGIAVKYEPVPKEQFRSRANCGKKDTVFVDRERLTFYGKDFPSDLAWSGEVNIGDVMFIRIAGTAEARAASLAAQRD